MREKIVQKNEKSKWKRIVYLTNYEVEMTLVSNEFALCTLVSGFCIIVFVVFFSLLKQA